MDSTRTAHGKHVGSTWTVHGQHMDSTQTVHRKHVDSTQITHGQHIADSTFTECKFCFWTRWMAQGPHDLIITLPRNLWFTVGQDAQRTFHECQGLGFQVTKTNCHTVKQSHGQEHSHTQRSDQGDICPRFFTPLLTMTLHSLTLLFTTQSRGVCR